jgi:hypothetical protein
LAGGNTTGGGSNVYIGFESGLNGGTSTENTFVGWNAGREGGGGVNTFIGADAGSSNGQVFTGFQNVLVGTRAGFTIAGAARDNVCVGTDVCSNNDTFSGIQNTIIGNAAGHHFSSGSDNVFVGNDTGGGAGGAPANGFTGDENVLLGSRSGEVLRTGSGNVLLGFNTDTTAAGDNAIAVGSNSTTATDGIAIGSSSSVATNGIAIGSSSSATSNQYVVGSTTNRILEMAIGPNLHLVLPPKTGIVSGAPTAVFSFVLAASETASMILRVGLSSTDGTDFQSLSNIVRLVAVNKAGVISTANSPALGDLQVASAGALSLATSITVVGSVVTFNVRATSTILVAPVISMRTELMNLSTTTTLAITPL